MGAGGLLLAYNHTINFFLFFLKQDRIMAGCPYKLHKNGLSFNFFGVNGEPKREKRPSFTQTLKYVTKLNRGPSPSVGDLNIISNF